MKRLIFGAAVTAVVALACGKASAQYGYRGYDDPYGNRSLHFHQHYNGPSPRYYRPYYPSRSYGHYGNSFSETSRQIREAHSRYRFHTHPRSYYNTPRYRYRYGGR